MSKLRPQEPHNKPWQDGRDPPRGLRALEALSRKLLLFKARAVRGNPLKRHGKQNLRGTTNLHEGKEDKEGSRCL